MKHKRTAIVSAIYYPKPGYEDKFAKKWNESIYTLAKSMGATHVGLYHNEKTEEFLATAHWDEIEDAEKFLKSDKLKACGSNLNDLCLIPCSREIYDIFKEAA